MVKDELKDITLFPIPARDKLTVYFNDLSMVTSDLEIKNESGQLIQRISGNSNPTAFKKYIDISLLQPGFYILMTKSGNKIVIKKFCKI